MKYDTVIVGSGLTGAVIANLESKINKFSNILVIEKDPVIGGLCRDEYNEHGILTHKYGPHIFHTNDPDIWKFVNSFVKFTPYEYRVVSKINGEEYPLPFSLETVSKFFPPKFAEQLINELVQRFGFDSVVSLDEVINGGSTNSQNMAKALYQNFVEPYNRKQWNQYFETYGKETARRLQFRINYDTRYFNDCYCGIPVEGYTKLIERILDRSNIHVLLNFQIENLSELRNFEYSKLYWTGRVDRITKSKEILPYVSTRFDFITQFNTKHFQSSPQVNYPKEFNCTRCIEHKQITGQKHQHTTISYEYPVVIDENDVELKFMYPIRTSNNLKMYNKYVKEVQSKHKNLYICGRAGLYEYLNMDLAIDRAVKLVHKVNKK